MSSVKPTMEASNTAQDDALKQANIETKSNTSSQQEQTSETLPADTSKTESLSQQPSAIPASQTGADSSQQPQAGTSDTEVSQVPEKDQSELKSNMIKALQEQKQETTPVAYPERREPTEKSIIDHIIADHQFIRGLYNYYQHAIDIQEKTKVRNTVVRELVQHDECEQAILYPLLKHADHLGKQQYDRSLNEHQELRTALYPLAKAKIEEDPGYDKKFQAVLASACVHMDIEEAEVLPLLQEKCSQDDLDKAGIKFKNYKPLFTTRPHPDVPQEGVGLVLANIVIRPFDELRDILG